MKAYCNGPTMIFTLITLNHLNYKLIKLGPAFHSIIFHFKSAFPSNIDIYIYFVLLQVESADWPRNEF